MLGAPGARLNLSPNEDFPAADGFDQISYGEYDDDFDEDEGINFDEEEKQSSKLNAKIDAPAQMLLPRGA